MRKCNHTIQQSRFTSLSLSLAAVISFFFKDFSFALAVDQDGRKLSYFIHSFWNTSTTINYLFPFIHLTHYEYYAEKLNIFFSNKKNKNILLFQFEWQMRLANEWCRSRNEIKTNKIWNEEKQFLLRIFSQSTSKQEETVCGMKTSTKIKM